MKFRVSTAGDALIAALIGFFGSLVALFSENPELTIATVKQATWIVLGGTAIGAFLKAYQTLSIRRFVGKVTKEDQQ